MTTVLKYDRAFFALVSGLINAFMVFLAALLTSIFPGSMLLTPSLVLVDATGNLFLVYLATETPPSNVGQ